MRVTRQALQRIRHRHFGDRVTLVVQMALLLLPLSQRQPWVLSLMLGLLSVVLGAASGYFTLGIASAQVLATVITVAGQLYVAILIDLILSRGHRRLL